MNVLIACEESQRVCMAFRERGFTAFSADIQECSGGHPEWHIHGDVLPILNGNCEFVTQNGDKHKIDGKWDLIISHPPCFVAGTKVITYDGIKSIETVQVGDLVLTHLGRYRKVTQVMQKVAPSTVKLKIENCGELQCTVDHPFYTCTVHTHTVDGAQVRDLSDFEWKAPKDFIKIQQHVTYTTCVWDDIKEIPVYNGVTYTVQGRNHCERVKHVQTLNLADANLWYLLGRWVGDGHLRHTNQNGMKRLGGIDISVAKDKSEQLGEKIKLAGFNYYLEHKRTADNLQIHGAELAHFVEDNFGSGALYKHLPGMALRLTDELAIAFLNGYFDSDGYRPEEQNHYAYTSVSADLVYGIKYMINKYWKVACTVDHNKQHTSVIEGRTVNVHDLYTGRGQLYKTKTTHFINLDDTHILTGWRSITPIDEPVMVYNLSVEEDESYTANGLAVHNCTHLSLSGARHFEKKRADGRQREAIEFFMKFIQADCPHICVENPMNIMSGEEYIKTWFPDLWEKYPLPLKNYQVVSPHYFGSTTRKKTCYWLKELPALRPTNIVKPELVVYTKKDGRVTSMSADFCRGAGSHDSKQRSKTAPGIAEAMADQWGTWVNNLIEKQKGNKK